MLVLALVVELNVSFLGKSKSSIEMLLRLRLPSETGTSVVVEFSASTSDEITVFKAIARKSKQTLFEGNIFIKLFFDSVKCDCDRFSTLDQSEDLIKQSGLIYNRIFYLFYGHLQ